MKRILLFWGPIVLSLLFILFLLFICQFSNQVGDSSDETINKDQQKAELQVQIAVLYTHSNMKIPIRHYRPIGAGFIEATSVDGRKILTNSCTIIHDERDEK